MNPKTIKIAYWVLTILFALANIADATGGLMKAQAGIDSMRHLGYPLYVMTFLSILKLLGVVAILQTKFTTIKEWAYAGFAFTFIGALISHGSVGDRGILLIIPLIMLAYLLVLYYFWREFEQVKMV
jgi:DoxX-like family